MAGHLPTLVIVGRPNVGKSTMFNLLVGKRVAVVQDSPGITRDRLYASAKWKGYEFQVVDTGGILFGDDDPLVEQIRIQAQIAMGEADAVLFVVDAAEGLNAADWDLANSLRGFDKPIFVVANKADSEAREQAANEFYALGIGEVYPVSSLQKRGFDPLLKELFAEIEAAKVAPVVEEPALNLAIIGRPNVGKSSMLNAFSGEQRAIVSDIAGTTRDAVDTLTSWKGNSIRLIDTAGIRRRGKIQGSVEYYMVMRAELALNRADCALLVISGEEGLTDGDKRVAKLSLDRGRPLVIAVNKWDIQEPPAGNLGRSSPEKKKLIQEIKDHLPEMSYAPIRFTSAKEETGMEGVMKAVFKAVENWDHRISTGVLNRLVQEALFERPLTRKGMPVRVKFVTQPETRPPTFVLFCNKPDLLHFSYLRYIENKIRKEFPLEGTPIKLVVRASSEKDD